MNGGICTPVDASTYRCDCPPEYVGQQCEKKLECGPNACGNNAECSIGNHQITCVCKTGFTGDPFVDCSQRTVTALISGDPHYRTFDGCHFDYMGTCPYYFVVPCNGTLPEPFGRFIIKAKNILPFEGSSASSLRQIELELYGLSLYVDASTHHLYVNGISTTMPYFYPNEQNAKVSVTFINRMVLIRTDTNIVVRFTFGLLSVHVPDVDALRGPDVLCGLAGNIDSNCMNDFRTLDGLVLRNDRCRPKKWKNEFGDSYIITDPNGFFTPGERHDSQCLRGAELKLPRGKCKVTADIVRKCEEIRNAAYGYGLFAKCQGLENIHQSFKDCVHDTCFGSTAEDKAKAHCQPLEVFVKLCQSSIPNTPLQWRKEMNCDELNCPTHSSPKMCATACPRTCYNPNPSLQCNEACSEGCECDPGYYLDTSDPAHPECVKLEQCGCNDPDGNHHTAEEIWLSKNCTSKNVCKNGILYTEAINCSKNAICDRNPLNLIYRCSCREVLIYVNAIGSTIAMQIVKNIDHVDIVLIFSSIITKPKAAYILLSHFLRLVVQKRTERYLFIAIWKLPVVVGRL
uniref:Zonadhesin n=1 Tax=Ascaris suum TaxID=6253 RepID=F1KVG8_ASCSU